MLRKRICIFLSIVLTMTLVFPFNYNGNGTATVFAEETVAENEDVEGTSGADDISTAEPTADTGNANNNGNLRLIFTTDIHGQVLNYNYQTGKNLSRGLNRVYTMIQNARAEVPQENYMTFDLGDSVMDFNTDYIYSQDTESLQPVYNAMTMINYDAITLGNHDFDFGYDYIVSQLEMSGLMNICVLSNVYSSINGDSVFGVENKIIEKTIKAQDGTDISVKVGILGETVPGLSTRTEGYKNKLATEDIIENAKKQAASLKEQGADIVIALAHSGFGTETPSPRSQNAAYALTKIDGIDVVLAGHEHIDFPVSNKNDVHYSLPNVDKETGLVNGKRLVMIKDSCRGIGVVDLDIKLDENNKVTLGDTSYEIRKTKDDIPVNENITNTMAEWDVRLREYCAKQIGNIAAGDNWNNYNALFDSNEIIQSVHNAQLQYASNYIANNAAEYKDYPIVSITRYTKYGSESGADYADLSGTIVEGNADSFANYHRYVYIYKINGKQLREWMEWSASIYQTANTSSEVNWNNIVLADYIKKERGDSLVQEDFISEWNRFFQFDGVEYTVDISKAPRYDYDGDKINDTNRITKITRNGQEVTDNDEFIIVTDKIIASIQTQATEGAASQVVSKSHVILQDIVQQYLQQKALLGDLEVTVNHNMTLVMPENYKYMLVSGTASEKEFTQQEWCEGVYETVADFNYYKCKNTKKYNEADKDAPGVVLSQNITSETNDVVEISVLANDKSGISSKKYAYGVYGRDDEVWTSVVTTGGAISMTGNTFEADKSGVYSVYVEDGAGNVTIEKIAVRNIYPEILLKPTVNKVDNNDVKVTGMAEPNVTIYVVSGESTYEDEVAVDGSFSVKISPQKAKSKISVYVEDSTGRVSQKTSVTVKRVGPNCPTITSANNNDTKIVGNANDSNVKLYALINNVVYVSKSLGSSYYTKCKKYDKTLTIKKVDITVKDNGSYTITIPNQYAGTKVKVFTVDTLGRVSHARSKAVKRAAPNRVTLYECSDVERYVFGYTPEGNNCRAAVKIGSKIYRTTTDEEGYFSIKVGALTAGSTITAYAYKNSGGTTKRSILKNYVVSDAKALYTERRDVKIHIDVVTDKDKVVSGKWTEPDSKIYICAGGQEYITTTDENGKYKVELNSKLAIGSAVFVMSRSTKGGINGMRRFNVILGAPIAPVVVGRVTVKTRYLKVYTKEACDITLKIGNKTYTKSKNANDKEGNRYYYQFKIARAKAGAKIRAYAKNSAGRTVSKIKEVKKK